jgi:hypothetical protein
LLFEELEGFLAGAADAFVYVARPRLHLLVHPVTAGVAVDDADPLPDRVKYKLGLLGDQGPFEGEEVAGIGEDRVELVVAEGFDRLVDARAFDNVAVRLQRFEEAGVGSRMPRQNQDFSTCPFQAVSVKR